VVGLNWYNMQGERWMEPLDESAVARAHNGAAQPPPLAASAPAASVNSPRGPHHYHQHHRGGGGGGRVTGTDVWYQQLLQAYQATADRLARGLGLKVLGQHGAEEVSSSSNPRRVLKETQGPGSVKSYEVYSSTHLRNPDQAGRGISSSCCAAASLESIIWIDRKLGSQPEAGASRTSELASVNNTIMTEAIDLAEQALSAKEQGIAEILRLLQHPEDLSRLADITAEYESRHRTAKATLSAMVQSQVEATRMGMDLLERAHRHIVKLQAALERIDNPALFPFVSNPQNFITIITTIITMLVQVLSEIEDIVDLPYRADRCWEMLEADEANLVPAFEALVLLTGTAENAKQAWQRCVRIDADANVVVSETRDYLGNLTRLVRIVDRVEEEVVDPEELRGIEVFEEDTLRNLGVDEDLVRLPPSPFADPERLPGVVTLMESYVGRMAKTMTEWYVRILDADLRGEPKPAVDGTLRTLGAIDFFRILNQQVSIIEALNDHGEVLFQTARTALDIMRSFQDTQREILAGPNRSGRGGRGEGGLEGRGEGGVAGGRPMSLEMAVAFLNNNLTCYDESLEFAEDVQRQLSKAYRERLDVEDVCRGFLDVAKVRQYVYGLASQRAVHIMFNDPGLSSQVKRLYGNGNVDYLNGRTTATLIATLRDYFSDFKVWVAPPYLRRLAEAALEELVRRAVNMFTVAPPQATEALAKRMADDEADLMTYFESYVKLDRLHRHISVLADMRELMTADSTETFALAYSNLLTTRHTAFTLEVVNKILTSCRSDLTKKQ
ncbi:hypothetical protein VOLCADRAFT_119802, partial [Volvox carteri f. nagariensis]